MRHQRISIAAAVAVVSLAAAVGCQTAPRQDTYLGAAAPQDAEVLAAAKTSKPVEPLPSAELEPTINDPPPRPVQFTNWSPPRGSGSRSSGRSCGRGFG